MGRYEDRTDPVRVKALRHRVEHHDHRDGVCDLLTDKPPTDWAPGRCYLSPDWRDPEMQCSCEGCSPGARAERRRRRHEGKTAARNWTKEYA